MTQVLWGNASKAPYSSQSDLVHSSGLFAAGSEDLSVLICKDKQKEEGS